MGIKPLNPVCGINHSSDTDREVKEGGIIFEFPGVKTGFDMGDVWFPFLREEGESFFNSFDSIFRIVNGKDMVEAIGELFLFVRSNPIDEVPFPMSEAELVLDSGVIFFYCFDDTFEFIGDNKVDSSQSSVNEVREDFSPGMGTFFGEEVYAENLLFPVRLYAHGNETGFIVDIFSPNMETEGINLNGKEAICKRSLLPCFSDGLDLLRNLRHF